MAEEVQFASRTDGKRKYDDQATTPPPSTGPRRPTGFSAPIISASPTESNTPAVPSADDEFLAAKQRAQEIAARIFNNAEAKRPRNENGTPIDDPNDKGFSSRIPDLIQKPSGFSSSPAGISPSSIPVSYGSLGSNPSKKIDIPNGRVGVIIGKGGETIKYLQQQSGAKIQVTRDMDADPHSQTRLVELVGNSEQISKAEQLINEVLSEVAEAGGSGLVSRRFTGQAGAEQFSMKVPNNKVGLIIGKGGETIKNMQLNSGARIQLIPLHLPPGDPSTERTVYIDGTKEQIESAKQLVNEVISENRVRNPPIDGGYSQQGYRPPRPQTSWGPPGAPPMQQPGYGYMQPGAYPGAPPPYSQTPYAGYPPQPSAGWDQSSAPPSQQTTQGSGYDYYGQQTQQPPHGGSSTPADNSGYNYGQPPAPAYGQQQVSYGESGYAQPSSGQQGYQQEDYSGGGYHAPTSQTGYAQQPGYDQSQGYGSAPYGTSAQDGVPPSYGAQGPPTQVPPAQQAPPAGAQQGYSGQQPSTTTAPSYPAQPGYGVPPTSQPGYASQPPAQTGYGQSVPSYGPPQGQKQPSGQAVYGQTQPPQSGQGSGFVQPAPVQAGYPHSQPPTTQSGSAQSDSSHQRPAPSGYAPAATQPGYYGAPNAAPQPGYGTQQQLPYGGESYGGYSQPPVYSNDNGSGNAHGTYEPASGAQPVPQSGVAKASPQS